MSDEPIVFIVDDDADMRDSLHWLMQSNGLAVQSYQSVVEFEEAGQSGRHGCLILDVRMPGTSGLQFYERFIARGGTMPVIFITAYADVPTAVTALKSGAADFLEKPFDRQTLLERVQRAILLDAKQRSERQRQSEVAGLMAQLSSREDQVLGLLMKGLPNKTIAVQLKISERAVEMRRASLMKKLAVNSVPELVRLATQFEMAAVLFKTSEKD